MNAPVMEQDRVVIVLGRKRKLITEPTRLECEPGEFETIIDDDGFPVTQVSTASMYRLFVNDRLAISTNVSEKQKYRHAPMSIIKRLKLKNAPLEIRFTKKYATLHDSGLFP